MKLEKIYIRNKYFQKLGNRQHSLQSLTEGEFQGELHHSLGVLPGGTFQTVVPGGTAQAEHGVVLLN